MKEFRKYILIIIINLIPALLFAENNTTLFDQANSAYKKGQYDTAIAMYSGILRSGVESPEIYFNLANSYYKKKDIANAIFNYEHAHKLAPADDDINFNLQLAQTLVVDKINILPEVFFKKWIREFSEFYSSNGWAWMSIITFISFLLMVLVYLFSNVSWLKKLGFWLGVFAIFISITSFANSYNIKQSDEQHGSAIIMSASVTIKSSPDEDGTDLFVLHEGSKVWIIDHVGEWYKVKIADGNSGWIKKSEFEEI